MLPTYYIQSHLFVHFENAFAPFGVISLIYGGNLLA